jgi:hypothetical protein
MNANAKQTASPQELFREHSDLRSALELVAEAITARQARPDVMAEMIDQAVERVLTHFRREEQSGQFAVPPHLAVRADGLVQEHEELTLRLRAIQRHAGAADAASAWWQQLHDQWQQFLRQFEKHENAENSLLQIAVNEDLGAID